MDRNIDELMIDNDYSIQELLNFLSANPNSALIETKPEIDLFQLQFNKTLKFNIKRIESKTLNKIVANGALATEKRDIYTAELI